MTTLRKILGIEKPEPIRTKIECPYCIEGLVVRINGKLFCEDCTNEIKEK